MPVTPYNFRFCLIAVIGLTLCGCVSNEMAGRVKDFSDSTSAIATTTQNAYQKVDAVHQQRLQTKTAVNLATDPNAPDQGYTVVSTSLFNSDDLAIREKVLQGLSTYAASLSTLAGNSADTSFDTQAKALGTNIQNLDSDAVTLNFRKSNILGSSEAGALTTAITALGEWLIDYKREIALKAAVNKMKDPINNVTKLLAKEIGSSRNDGLRGVLDGDYKLLLQSNDVLLSHCRQQTPVPEYEVEQLYMNGIALQKQRTSDDAMLAQTASALLKIGQTHALLVDAANNKDVKLDDLISELKTEASHLVDVYKGT